MRLRSGRVKLEKLRREVSRRGAGLGLVNDRSVFGVYGDGPAAFAACHAPRPSPPALGSVVAVGPGLVVWRGWSGAPPCQLRKKGPALGGWGAWQAVPLRAAQARGRGDWGVALGGGFAPRPWAPWRAALIAGERVRAGAVGDRG